MTATEKILPDGTAVCLSDEDYNKLGRGMIEVFLKLAFKGLTRRCLAKELFPPDLAEGDSFELRFVAQFGSEEMKLLAQRTGVELSKIKLVPSP